jgi:starvation-inducible DNA-binding protein
MKGSMMASKTDKKAPPKKARKAAVPAPATLDIGIAPEQLEAITHGLSRLLADTYTLYLKTHNYHWNVTGPQFNTLHTMFETQYTELALAVDEIAERLRALGAWAPGSYSAFAQLSTVKEATGVPSANEMVAELAADQATVVRTARALFPAVEAASDEPTADLLTQRMQVHEKTAWMLRAMIA